MADLEFDGWDDIVTVGENEGQNIVDAFLNDTAVTADPKEVTPIEEDSKTEVIPPAKQNTPKQELPTEVDVLAEEEEDKVEDEDPKTEETPKEEDTTEEEPGEENTFLALSQDLVKLGLFEEGEDEELPTDGKAFLEKYKAEAKKEANTYLHGILSQFGEDRLQLFNDLILKGVPVKDYLQTYANVETFTDIDLTKASNQEKVVRASLTSQGWESEDIESEIERIKEEGDLERISKNHHKAVVKQETKKLQEQSAQAEQKLAQEQAYEQQYLKAVNSTLSQSLKSKDFEGIPVTPAVAKAVQEDLTIKKYKLPSGELLTEFDKLLLDIQNTPDFFNIKVKMALLAQNNFDLTKVAQKLKTQETNELFESVARQTKKTAVKKSPKQSAPSQEEDDFMKALSFLK